MSIRRVFYVGVETNPTIIERPLNALNGVYSDIGKLRLWPLKEPHNF